MNKVINVLKKFTKMHPKAQLKDYTTFKIGGKAVVVEPQSVEELVKVIDTLKTFNTKYFVLGNGSNVLFSSSGYDGIIISMKNFNRIEIHGTKVIAGAGATLNSVIKASVDKGLKGMEDGFLIPGTVGGAVKMNASAYNYKTSDVVSGVLVLRDYKITLLSNNDCNFGYRHSNIKDGDIILRVQFNLTHSHKKELKQRLNEILQLRQNKIKYPSAGSVFKNANGYFAGQLIDQLGLKGLKQGGAMVSHEHANVIVNLGNATSDDVLNLIKQIQNKIKESYDIDLQTEINLIQ